MLNRVAVWIKRIGELRDGILLIITGVYLIGFLVWMYHAWQNNLGLLPLLDAQYLIAGIIPSLIALVVGVVIPGVFWFRKRALAFLNAPTKFSYFLRGAVLITFVFCVPYYFVLNLRLGRTPVGQVLFFVILVSGFFLPPLSQFAPSLSRFAFQRLVALGTAYVFLFSFVLLYGYVGIVVFLEIIFPAIPQEFGGGRPRCAFLDVETNLLSSQASDELFSKDETKLDNHTIRSKQLYVLFSGSDFLLVRSAMVQNREPLSIAPWVPQATLPTVWVEPPKYPWPFLPDLPSRYETSTYEIKKDIVKAIYWCNK